MNFYDRYVQTCEEKGVTPCSASTADALNITKATISQWGRNNSVPNGVTLAKIADMLDVSADYLLLRTDDPEFKPDPNVTALGRRLVSLITRLDDRDRQKLESVVEGMLMSEKYEETK